MNNESLRYAVKVDDHDRVIDYVIITNEDAAKGIKKVVAMLELSGTWHLLEANHPPAGVGLVYDKEQNEVKPDKPFPSWTWNKKNRYWESPVAYTGKSIHCIWIEAEQKWLDNPPSDLI